jgi:hypothetical protein
MRAKSFNRQLQLLVKLRVKVHLVCIFLSANITHSNLNRVYAIFIQALSIADVLFINALWRATQISGHNNEMFARVQTVSNYIQKYCDLYSKSKLRNAL